MDLVLITEDLTAPIDDQQAIVQTSLTPAHRPHHGGNAEPSARPSDPPLSGLVRFAAELVVMPALARIAAQRHLGKHSHISLADGRFLQPGNDLVATCLQVALVRDLANGNANVHG